MLFPRLLPAIVLLSLAPQAAGQPVAPPDAIELFVAVLEQIAGTGDRDKLLALAHPDVQVEGLSDFADSFDPAPSRAVIKERDRVAIDTGGHRLLLEVFHERGIEGRVSTWRADLRGIPAVA